MYVSDVNIILVVSFLLIVGLFAYCRHWDLKRKLVDVQKKNRELEIQLKKAILERDTISSRYEAKRDHLCLIRDLEIERLTAQMDKQFRAFRVMKDGYDKLYARYKSSYIEDRKDEDIGGTDI